MVGFISYRLLHPIKNLVIATEKIAEGDLNYKIPVQSGDELGKLTRSFNSMVKELNKIQTELVRSEKLISMGRLSSGVAHEIRNPLNAMKGAIVFMQKKRSDDRFVNEYTNIILEEINRLNEFVTEFLYFAKQSEPKCVPTDFNAIINNTLNLFEEEIRKNNISVNKFLENVEHISTKALLEQFYKEPSLPSLSNSDVLVRAIQLGVKEGAFGLIEIEDDEYVPDTLKFKRDLHFVYEVIS